MVRRQELGLVAAMPFADDVRCVARAAKDIGERLLGGSRPTPCPGKSTPRPSKESKPIRQGWQPVSIAPREGEQIEEPW